MAGPAAAPGTGEAWGVNAHALGLALERAAPRRWSRYAVGAALARADDPDVRALSADQWATWLDRIDAAISPVFRAVSVAAANP